jgi:hypothetical protein
MSRCAKGGKVADDGDADDKQMLKAKKPPAPIMVDGKPARARLDRPGRRMKRADGGGWSVAGAELMGPIERILIGLALVAALLLLRLATRRFRLPPPPLLLPLVAVLLWCVLGNITRPAGVQWLGAVDELATAYALIALLAWLGLECPEALGWWRPTAKILRDLLSLGLSALATVLVFAGLPAAQDASPASSPQTLSDIPPDPRARAATTARWACSTSTTRRCSPSG